MNKLLIVILLLPILGWTQIQTTKMRMAEGLEEQQKFYQAIDIYIEVVQSDKNNKQAIKKIAETFDRLNHTEEALKWYKELMRVAETEFPESQFRYAQLLKSNEEFDEAIYQFKLFLQNCEGTKKYEYNKIVKQEIEVCEMAKTALPNENVVIKRLNSVNHAYNDLAPVVKDEVFYFTSIPTDTPLTYLEVTDSIPTMQIYQTHKIDKEQDSLSFFLPKITQEKGMHSGNLAFSLDGNRIYFTKCKQNLQGKMICKIYGAKKTSKGWSDAVLIKGELNDEKNDFSTTHPTLSFEERREKDILFFASDRPMGRGGFDIWVCNIDEDFNSDRPKNLGSRINSSLNEITPYYNVNEEYVYYASNGLASFGGYDIYKAKDKGRGRLDLPEHLPKPTNSGADDFYYFKSTPQNAYFVSNRNGSKAYNKTYFLDDIYLEETMSEKYLSVKVYTNDSLKNHLKDAIVSIKSNSKSNSTDTIVKSGKAIKIVPNEVYSIVAQKNGYVNYIKDLSIDYMENLDTLFTEVFLDKVELNKEAVLNEIYFATNSFELEDNSQKGLDELYQFMIDNPSFIIEIGAHTDNKGAEEYNIELSQKRAHAVEQYLLDKGIGKNRLTSVGYGQTKPVADNSTEEGRRLNRRISFKIIKVTN